MQLGCSFPVMVEAALQPALVFGYCHHSFVKPGFKPSSTKTQLVGPEACAVVCVMRILQVNVAMRRLPDGGRNTYAAADMKPGGSTVQTGASHEDCDVAAMHAPCTQPMSCCLARLSHEHRNVAAMRAPCMQPKNLLSGTCKPWLALLRSITSAHNSHRAMC
jgi:hypothetical protein